MSRATTPNVDGLPVGYGGGPRSFFVLLIALLLCIPLDFVVVPPTLRTIYVVVVAVGAGGLLLRAIAAARSNSVLFLAVLAVGMLPSILVGGITQPALLFAAEIMAGYYWATHRRLNESAVLALLVLHGAAAIVDGILSIHFYQSIFSAQIFIPDSNVFRARGIIGHPVPAAAVVVWLGLVSLSLGGPARIPRTLHFATVGVIVGGTLWATGTRSAGALFVLGIAALSFRSRENRRVLGTLVRVSLLLAVPLFFFVRLGLVSEAARLRILVVDDSVLASDSYVVRSRAVDVVASIPDPCGVPCLLAGHGNGSLQTELRSGFAVRGASTLDNWYVSAYWDYGVIGLIVVMACLLWAIRRFRLGDEYSAAGALGMLLVFGSALFYDSLYLASGALLMGVFAAMAFGDRNEVRPDGQTGIEGSGSGAKSDRLRPDFQH